MMIDVVRLGFDSAAQVEIDGDDTLSGMYEIIGCHSVDVVALADGIDMWLDDEGLYNSPINPIATAVARSFGHVHQPYFGVTLVTGNKGADTTGLTHAQVIDVVMRAMGGVAL